MYKDIVLGLLGRIALVELVLAHVIECFCFACNCILVNYMVLSLDQSIVFHWPVV